MQAENPINDIFWWLRHDFATYKRPMSEGKALLPMHYLVPGFVLDVTEYWYSFVHGREDRRIIGDFSSTLNNSGIFVNERAYCAFQDMFTRHGRAHPVRCSNMPHWIVLIDTLHEACDLQRSKFRRMGSREPVEDDIGQFFKIVLREGFKTDDDIFRLDGSFALNNEIAVSDRFKRRYEQSGLTGLLFRPTDGSSWSA